MFNLTFSVAYGMSFVIMKAFNPEEVLKIIEREKINYAFFVPAMAIALLQVPDFDKYDLSSLKYWISASASFPIEVKNRYSIGFLS